MSSDATVERVAVSEHTNLTSSVFGDGIVVWALDGNASGAIRTVHVHASARAAISAFGADISVATSLLACNAIDLNGDNLGAAPFSFTDGGGNVCGCDGQAEECKLLSLDLEPPTASR
jgi:hypothetical protein